MKSRFDHVTVFVVRLDDKGTSHEILQLRRSGADYLGGTWQAVRGCIEPPETAVAAALRELREEAGLNPQEFYSLGPAEVFYMPHDDAIWHSVTFCAIVNRDQSVTLNDEHDAHRWIPRNEILHQMMWASERALFQDLCRDILDESSAKPYLRIDL